MNEAAPRTQSAAPAQADLGLTMTQILRNPLAALRAQMETLAGEFRADDPRQQQLRGALDHVLKLSRDVDALSQYATPRSLAPLSCSVDEILHTALRGLRFEHHARVKLANAAAGTTFDVDGPVLADCLTRLLENALAGPDEWVLLSARPDHDGGVTFSIVEGVEDKTYAGHAHANAPEHRNAALKLGLLLAHRDIQRMGGHMEVTHTMLGNTCVRVSIPTSVAERR